MTTLYRPTDALTPEDRKVPGILITQYPRAMYLVPIEAEEEIERRIPFDGRSGEDLPPSKGGRYRRAVYTTPWEAS